MADWGKLSAEFGNSNEGKTTGHMSAEFGGIFNSNDRTIHESVDYCGGGPRESTSPTQVERINQSNNILNTVQTSSETIGKLILSTNRNMNETKLSNRLQMSFETTPKEQILIAVGEDDTDKFEKVLI